MTVAVTGDVVTNAPLSVAYTLGFGAVGCSGGRCHDAGVIGTEQLEVESVRLVLDGLVCTLECDL